LVAISKYLVTGAAGFIGSNLCKHLLSQGHDVTGMDNLSLGVKSNLPEHERFSFFPFSCQWVDTTRDFDGVFHLAACSSAPMFAEHPSVCMHQNISGFNAVAEHCSKHKIPLVYASTSSMMENGVVPVPKTFYELSKFVNEESAKVYSNERGLRSIGLRFFSVYGPNELHKGPYANLATQFLKSVLRKEPVTIYGDGSQTRDFVFVDDVVAALALSMEQLSAGPDGGGVSRFYSVGTGYSYSLTELVKAIEGVTQKRCKVNHVINPIKNYVFNTLADSRQFVPGWDARVGLLDGLEKVKKHLEDERVV